MSDDIVNGMNCLEKTYSENIRPYIDVIDNLRRIGLQQDIDLPKIVVVGDQSSGKSSILEAISGIELPRGTGIVTRCPLEMQLQKTTNKVWKAILSYKDKYGTRQEEIIDEPSMVESAITSAQNKMCTTEKGISKELITLRVESPSETAPDLTLIDLPGIARVAVDGQPSNICDQIKDIIKYYVQNINTIILCIVSANLDAAVNESINIAKTYDKDGTRTLGVISKPDIAHKTQKEDVLSLLNNEKIPLVKGYHMVKCRSQDDLNNKISLSDSLLKENKFFLDDEVFKTANPDQMGTLNLSRKITEHLVDIIKKSLPKINKEISEMLKKTKDDLSKLPDPVPSDKHQKRKYLNKIIVDVNADIRNSLFKGKSSTSEKNHFNDWRNYFENFRGTMKYIFAESLEEEFDVSNLKIKINQRRGAEISGFLNYELFEELASNHVTLYKDKAMKLLKELSESTEYIVTRITEDRFSHLPMIKEDLKKIMHQQIISATKTAEDRLEIIFNGEKLVFTMDSEFDKQMEALRKEEQEKLEISRTNQTTYTTVQPTKLMENNSEKLLKMIKCYTNIAHSRLCDIIPITLRYALHIELYEKLSNEFLQYSCDSSIQNDTTERKHGSRKLKRVHEKIVENKELAAKRERLNQKIQRLVKGSEEVEKI